MAALTGRKAWVGFSYVSLKTDNIIGPSLTTPQSNAGRLEPVTTLFFK